MSLKPLQHLLREPRLPVLETARLVMRAPRLEDAKAIAALANDRRVAENTTRIPHPYTIADAMTDIATLESGAAEASYLLTLRDGTVVGLAGLSAREGKVLELGYWLGVAFWSRGFATEAARALIDFSFDELGCEALHAGARVSNPASRRVLEKCGFQWTGVNLCRIRAIASSAPIDRFRLERGIWSSLKSWGPMRRVA